MGRRVKEIWKKIKDERIKGNYWISNWGNIKNDKDKFLKPFKDKDGYLRISLQSYVKNKKIKKYLHRLVAEYFIDETDILNKQVNHKNFKKDNNYYKNLEWVSNIDNIKHSRKYSRQMTLSCSAHGMSTFTNEEVENICYFLEKGLKISEILSNMGYKKKTKEYEKMRSKLKHIKNRKTWKPISCNYNF